MVNRAFQLGVAAILRDPSRVKKFDMEGRLEDLFVTSSRVDPNELISFSAVAEGVHSGILVTGHLSVGWTGECVRCLKEARGGIRAEVCELFEENADPDGESYPYTGVTLDLTELISDTVVLNLPVVPLCNPQCKGLCVICGGDLNLSDCTDHQLVSDPRWAALGQLEDWTE